MAVQRQWYYMDRGVKKGPISEDQLALRLRRRHLSSRTLVWTPTISDWTEARNIRELAPPRKHGAASADTPDDGFAPTGKQIRPWIRLWARLADVLLFALAVHLFARAFYEPLTRVPDTIYGTLLTLLYIPVETALLSTWGATPGKWLFHIHLSDTPGDKPAVGPALVRSFNVWIWGVGIGLLPATLFALFKAFNKLTRQGITSWDKEGGFVVQHRSLSTPRALAAAATLTALSALFLVK